MRTDKHAIATPNSVDGISEPLKILSSEAEGLCLHRNLAASIESSRENPESTPVCEVICTRNYLLAHRTFASMTQEARVFLWTWLDPGNKYEAAEMPDPATATGEQFLWHELLRAAREADGSFFIVNEFQRGEMDQVFISPDLVGAQCYACQRGGGRVLVDPVHKCRTPRHARSSLVRIQCQWAHERSADFIAAKV
jgi:hypothetical protein